MQRAILKVLKNATINAFPSGQLAPVDLFCAGAAAEIENVFINSSFTEFPVGGTGRIYVVKITCGLSVTYALGNKADLLDLQKCCNTQRNIVLPLACPAIPPITVFSVTGDNLGSAATPLEYVNLWNGNANNQILGKLYTGLGWQFNLFFNSGNFRPLSLQCTGSPAVLCPSITFPAITATTVTVNWTAVTGATQYRVEVRREGQTSGFATATVNGLTANFSSLQSNSVHHVTVQPFVDGAFVTTCPAADFTTIAQVQQVGLRWGWTDADPYTNDTTAPVFTTRGETFPITPGAPLNTDFSFMPSQKYAIVEYPATEANKTIWADTGSAPNNGSIPDAAFRAIFTVAGKKYIVARNPIDFDTAPTSRVIFS